VKNRTAITLLTALLLGLHSCTTLPTDPPKWKFQENAIILNLKADHKLNVEKGKSYSLYLVVYQLADPNAFNQLAKDRSGRSKLLESDSFDSSVTAVKNMVIYPGSDVTHRLDRAEGAKWVGIVAGYRAISQEENVRLFEIPIDKKEEGFFFQRINKMSGLLNVQLNFGPRQIEDSKAIEVKE